MNTLNLKSIDLDAFDGETFCRAACWFDLNVLANADERKIMWLGKVINLKSRQLATSVKLLADRWNMTAQSARNRLNEFVEAGFIAMERIGTALIITISPSDDDRSEPIAQTEQPTEQPTEQELPVEPETSERKPSAKRDCTSRVSLQRVEVSNRTSICERAKLKIRQRRLVALRRCQRRPKCQRYCKREGYNKSRSESMRLSPKTSSCYAT